VVPGARRTLHFEVIPVELIKVIESADQESVHRHPNRPAPIGITPKHSGVGFRRQILDFVFLTSYVKNEGMVEVVTRKGTYAVRSKEFVLVEHIGEDAPDLLFVAD
jgi:hypothetical protein